MVHEELVERIMFVDKKQLKTESQLFGIRKKMSQSHNDHLSQTCLLLVHYYRQSLYLKQ